MKKRAPIDATQHAWLDYGVAATFLLMAARYRRRNPAASRLAAINGAMILGVSALTDYPGGLMPVFSFKTHGMLDGVQAALAGVGPMLFGFEARDEARFFYAQAASEAGVIAATDWTSGHRQPRHGISSGAAPV